jgi:DTW domain-containing protein YfiP
MRETCYRCFWPKPLCWCPSIVPMATRTRLVFLMHPKEYKQEKAATGRLTHLCLPNSEIVMGIGFDAHERVQELIADPSNLPVLLYPGRDAINLSDADSAARVRQLAGENRERRLVVFVLDATWPLARKMLNLSPTLKQLPRVMFTASTPSRYVIKQQPMPGCLSTLEAVHELLTALAQAKLDEYPLPDQLLGLFERMQRYQIECALDPARGGYRRAPYSDPGERKVFQGRSARRRTKLFIAPANADERIAK